MRELETFPNSVEKYMPVCKIRQIKTCGAFASNHADVMLTNKTARGDRAV
jgi:hypothetical protein